MTRSETSNPTTQTPEAPDLLKTLVITRPKSWLEGLLKPEAAKALKEQKLLWITLAPSFETKAWENSRALFAHPLVQPNFARFEHLEVDACLYPEIDLAAQSLLQSLAGQKGWPVNLILDPESLKPIIGFSLLDPIGLKHLLTQMLDAFVIDPIRLGSFAEKSFAKATELDPLRFAAVIDAPLETFKQAEAFYVTPMIQSLSAETGLFGNSGLLYPGAYNTLVECALAPEDERAAPSSAVAPNLGEIALTKLVCSPSWDLLGGGFFRETPARAIDGAPTGLLRKCARENAEMLEVLVDAYVKHKSPFLYEASLELVECLMTEMRSPKGDGFYEYVAASADGYLFAATDLLEALPASQRAACQAFFNIRSELSLPRYTGDLSSLSKQLAIEPVDLKNMLKEATKTLRNYRSRRASFRQMLSGAPSLQTSLRTVEALFYAAEQLGSVSLGDRIFGDVQSMLPRLLRMANEATLAPMTSGSQGLQTRLYLAMTGAKFSLLKWALKSDRVERLKTFCPEIQRELREHLSHLQFLDYTVETGFLGSRYDLVDHFGASAVADEFRILERAYCWDPTSLGTTESLHYLNEEALLYLSRTKRLGIVASSLYASCLKFHRLAS